MTLGDLLGTIKNLGTKVTGSLGSMLSSPTPTAPAKPLTVGDWFAPKTIPETISMPKIAGIPLETQQNAARTASELVAAGRKAVAEYPAKVAAANAERFPQGTELVTGTPEQKKVAMGKLFNLVGGFVGGTNPFTGFTAAEKAGARTIGNSLLPMVQSAGTKIETAITDMVNAVTPRAANAVLLKLGMAPEVATKIAPAIAKTTTPKEVVGVLRSIQPKTPEVAPVKPTVAQTTAPEVLYHGTNDIGWVNKGEPIRKSETSTMGSPGIFFSSDPAEAASWVSASGGRYQNKQEGILGGVVKLSKKGADQFNLKNISSKDYEQAWLDAMKELRANPEKFGTDQYGVHEQAGWKIVEDRLIGQGYDGVKLDTKSGVLFDPAQVQATLHSKEVSTQGGKTTFEPVVSASVTPAKTPATDVTLYRAGETNDPQGRGIFLSQNEATAQAYQNTGTGGKIVTPYTLSGDANIKDAVNRWQLVKELDPTWNKEAIHNKYINEQYKNGGKLINGVTAETRLEVEAERRIKNILEKQGFDGVKYSGGVTDQTGEYQIFNTGKLKTAAPATVAPKAPATDGRIFDEAKSWLYDMQNADNGMGVQIVKPSQEVIDFLSQYRPNTAIKLYRGVRADQTMGATTGYESWSRSKQVASNFAQGGSVVTKMINPEDILVDIKSIPKSVARDLISGVDHMAESEVIVKSGLATPEPATVSTMLKPKGVKGAPSVADIIGGDRPPIVPRETVTGPIPNMQPERNLITRAKEFYPDVANMLEGKYTPKKNADLIDKALQNISMDWNKAMTLARTKTSDEAVATGSILARLLDEEAVRGGPRATQALIDKTDLINDAARNLTELGRGVQAAKLWGKLTPDGMALWTSREIQNYNEKVNENALSSFFQGRKKVPELTPDQLASITGQMKDILAEVDSIKKAQKFQALQNEIRSILPSDLSKKLLVIWKVGLLTGIRTSGINIASNTSHAISEISKDLPASVADRIRSMVTGKARAVLAPNTQSLAAFNKGFAEGAVKGWRMFRTGYDELNGLETIDFNKVNFGNGPIAKALQIYTDKVFNTLGAEDMPFYYGARAYNTMQQARAIAYNEGLRGSEMATRAEQIAANPTDEIATMATADAMIATFRNSTSLSKLASMAKNTPGIGPLAEVIMPFSKTPSAVATQMVNYLPTGFIKPALRIVAGLKDGTFDERSFAHEIGRAVTGTVILAYGMYLLDQGLMTTSRPTKESEKNQWEMEGKQPWSIYLAGKWRTIGFLGPAGMALATGAAIREGQNKTGSYLGGLGSGLASIAPVLTQQAFLAGVNNALNALQDPGRYGENWVASFAGSIIPTISSDIARATDTTERSTGSISARIASRVPGLREMLAPRVDTLGNIETTPGFITAMFDFTRPYQPTENANDTVMKELTRLDRAGFNATPTMVGSTYGYDSLTAKQNSELWQEAGTLAYNAIDKEMKTQSYTRYDDEQKMKILQKVIDPTKSQAIGKVIFNTTQGLTGEILAQKLIEMQQDKLLTKNSFAWYRHYGGRGKYPIQTP